ncbi:HK97 family phage prohead protease [Miltoncostaea marina]|uniref:HK97 family phage prohead protease n=1 Tax=Miltoncostaea marina TaxID=2843215 RepID=UPI001C3CA9D7|nr:HK97 family phage prohead protease [Miltoncostaea marina]
MRRRPDVTLGLGSALRLAAEVNPAGGPDADGRFSCVAAIFDVPIPRIFYSLVLRPGCFDRSLAERGLPSLLHDHDWSAVIGTVERCEADEQQLVAGATLFPPDTDRLREVRLAMTARNGDGRAPLREFSVGFDIRDARWDVLDDDEVLAVYDAQLWEFSVTLAGGILDSTGFLRAEARDDELLARFPREARPGDKSADLSAAARRKRALARAHLL